MTEELRRAWLAVAGWFTINGFGWATFVVRFPEVKAHLGFSNSMLGMALLSGSLSVILILRPAGRLAAKFGSRRVMTLGLVYSGSMLPLLTWLPNTGVLFLSMFLFMSGYAATDVSMNAHAVLIEHRSAKVLMGRFHAMWSVGSLAGGIVGGLLASHKVPLLLHGTSVGLILVAFALVGRKWLLPSETDRHAPDGAVKRRHRTPGVFWLLGSMGLAAAIGEGAATDWGAVLLRETWKVAPFGASLPFIVFSAAMVLGRFSSDSLSMHVGRKHVLVTSGLIGGIGLVAGLVIGHTVGIVFAWLCLGFGGAVVIPMVFSLSGSIAIARFPGALAPAEAVAVVSGISYFAFFAGPPTIGFLADLIGLRWALLLPALLSLWIPIGARLAGAAIQTDSGDQGLNSVQVPSEVKTGT